MFGKVELFRGRRQMTNPVVDLVGDQTGRIVPVYPQSEKAGVMSWDIAAGWRRCSAGPASSPTRCRRGAGATRST